MELSSIIEELTNNVDPVTIATELKNHSIISASNYNYILSLFADGRNRQDIWRNVFDILGQTFSIKDILKILENSGYSDIATKLCIQYMLSQRCQTNVKRLESSNRHSQILFVNLKINTHNNIFINPRDFLRSLSSNFKRKFENATDGFSKAQRADKYAAVLCAEIDSHTMLYKKEFPTHGLFDELKRIAPYTSDFHVTNVAYSARMGIAYAIAEDLNKAEDYMKDARVSSYNIEQCVEMDNMLYIHVFNLLCEYEKQPTTDLRERILEVANMGLQCLQYDEDPIRTFWKPMFFLRIIYCYLGLSNKGDPIQTAFVDKACIEKSKKLLGEIDRFWTELKIRRQMFYYAARARIHDLEGNTDSAIVYLGKAIEIGTTGKFGELPYIANYHEKLKDKKHNHSKKNPPMTYKLNPLTTSTRSAPKDDLLDQELPVFDFDSLLSERQTTSHSEKQEWMAVDEFAFSTEHVLVTDSCLQGGRIAVHTSSPGTTVFSESSPQEMLILNQDPSGLFSTFSSGNVRINLEDVCYQESPLSSGVLTALDSSPQEMLILNADVFDADETDLKTL